MANQFLKILGAKRRNPNYPLTKIEGWILPAWFKKQSDPLSPGYTANLQFSNICYRNWSALGDSKGEQTVFVDPEGVISLPKIGVSVEVWIHDGASFFTPGNFLQTKQQSDLDFPCIKTKSFFPDGICKSTVFPLTGVRNSLVGMEIMLTASGEAAFRNFLILLVIRPYDHNGLTTINRLEYRNRKIKVNNGDFLELELEPQITFFSHAGRGDVTEYFRLERNNTTVYAPDGSGTGLIGYLVRPADLIKLKLVFKPDPFQILLNKRSLFWNNWFFDSKQLWKNRFDFQHCMLSTGTKVDFIYHTNLNYLKMFSGQAYNEEIAHLLVLNRFALYNQSCHYLKTALKKMRWDGSSINGFLSPEKLIFALTDYYKLSGDRKLVENSWPVLKRTGLFLSQNKSLSRHYFGDNYDGRIFWICAAFKALAALSEICGCLDETQFFRDQYQELWSEILSTFSRRLKEAGNGLFSTATQGIESLCASYPLQLFERNEKFINVWLSHITGKYLFNGGVFSPLEFQGFDLKLTVQLGEILIREEKDYDSIMSNLIDTVSPNGSWPDRIHPLSGGGIGQNGHELKVGIHFLLLLRNIMVFEEGEVLYLLPGVFTSNLWGNLTIELNRFPTFFGDISLKCRSIGDIAQIEFNPFFRKRPRQIRLLLKLWDRIIYADADVWRRGGQVELSPEFRLIRIRRVLPKACLDNTFAGKL